MNSVEHGCGDNRINEKNLESVIDLLSDKVKEVHLYRDHYFENHAIDRAVCRNNDVEKQVDNLMTIFNENKDCAIAAEHRANFYYLKGAALNISPLYSREAEDLLSKAIKLDKNLLDAWNELGDCYCKNNNIKAAIDCFNNALALKRNKIALRSLSMLARQEKATTKEEKITNIERGLTFAKEAVQLDTNDGLSWAVLGNAHLSSFFGISQNPRVLKQCLSAYIQAEKDAIAKSSPDLHYNKAVVLRYEEDYHLAIESFERAIQFDPVWEPPLIKRKQLLKYLDSIVDYVSTSGRMKAKRLSQILQSIDSKQLGPYGSGSYTSSTTGQTITLQLIDLNSLKPGLNEEKVILGKVVCSVHNEDGIPFTFCLVDRIGTCVAVTVYNIADGKGVIIGDSVAIPEPYVTDVQFRHDDKEHKFRSLRVETPIILIVNGKKVSRDLQAGVQISLFKKFD